MKRNLTKVGIIFIFVSLVFSFIAVGKRINLEARNNGVEIVLDSQDFQDLAFQEGISFTNLLKQLKDSGATTLSVPLLTWSDMEDLGYVGIFSHRELGRLILSGNTDPLISALYNQGNNSETYIIIKLGYDFSESLDILKGLIGYNRVSLFRYNSNNVFIVKTTTSNLRVIPTGLINTSLVEVAKGLGYRLIFRPINTSYLKPGMIPRLLKCISPYKDITSALVFQGTEVLGYPTNLEDMVSYVKDNGINIGITEFGKQKGMDMIAIHLLGNVSRVHSILSGEMSKLTPSEIVDRVVRAAKERNVRFIYLRPVLKGTTEKWILEENLSVVSLIKNRLEENGFKVGKASFIPSWRGFKLSFLGMGLGIAGAVMLLKQDFLSSTLILGFAFFSILVGGIDTIFPVIILRKLLALGVASVFPLVGIWNVLFFDDGRENYVISALKILLIALAGGVLIGGGLASTDFMLQINQFMGVKIAHILPFLFLAFLLFVREKDIVKHLIFYQLNILNFIVILVLIGGAVFYIVRTGNISSEAVWNWEITMRSTLEKIMMVRPRTQEFLIGYPAILLALEVLRRYREMGILLGIIALIAPVSVVNAFCHIHTPIFLTLFRMVNGFILGLVVGFIVLAIVKRFLNIYKREESL
ncbi:MAG: DUF5693 family protein [bacterium]